MNEEKASDTYWEKVSDMIEEAESKYKKTGISQTKLFATNLFETFLHVIFLKNTTQLKAH